MGGRGASVGGMIPTDQRFWAKIPESMTGKNEIDGVKIIYDTRVPNAHPPIESNTADTKYILADAKGLISQILVYKDHKLVTAVDILLDGTYHQHAVDPLTQRKRHSAHLEVDPGLKTLADKCVLENVKNFGLKILKLPKRKKKKP